ncbi:hypothetical protein N7537_010015 [Penicillium hordei]|uniref:Alcohol dehydrogenase-like C-terminal domain-containing protein n=1 Tax=Penicillium hordei TaxID=40994 RepID=A0AAD6DTX9_9EURO|nr:uncharacterized protein N7537_010015 [Penicillium hordei]KAJ5593111.1 hypothetical protein N7537_010015 [Penicillium hordei]
MPTVVTRWRTRLEDPRCNQPFRGYHIRNSSSYCRAYTDISTGSRAKLSERTPILIYSGGSHVGLFAIKIAKRGGLRVVVAASPRSFELVKRNGADVVFDYHSSTATSKIYKAYPNITKALDCFSEGKSSQFCAEVLSKGRVITLLDQGKPKKLDIL